MRLAVFPSPSTPKTQLERVEQTDPHITHIHHYTSTLHHPISFPSRMLLFRSSSKSSQRARLLLLVLARIYSHAVQNSESGSRSAASVIQLFQSFPDTEEAEDASAAAEAAITSPHLLNALRRGNGSLKCKKHGIPSGN